MANDRVHLKRDSNSEGTFNPLHHNTAEGHSESNSNHADLNGTPYISTLDSSNGTNTGGSGSDTKGPPQACLFVASLSNETTEESLRAFFAQSGAESPLKIKILKDRSARPYAFVQFQTVESANKAQQYTDTKLFNGRKIRVEKAKVNRTLFIAKMDRNFTTAQLREATEPYGQIENVSIIKNYQTNKSKGCGFVKFVYREDAMSAFTGLKNSQRKWIIEWATSTNDPESLGIDRNNIFVGGLNPNEVTKEILEEKFRQYGNVESLTLVNRDFDIGTTQAGSVENSSTQRNAYAFIRFTDSSCAEMAIEQENGGDWFNRKIRVQYCESQEMKNKRKANKYYNSLAAQFPNPYYRNSINPMVMMGGVPIYNMPAIQRNSFARKVADTPNAYPSTFVGYPPVMNPMLSTTAAYTNPNWGMYAAAAAAVQQSTGNIPHHSLHHHQHRQHHHQQQHQMPSMHPLSMQRPLSQQSPHQVLVTGADQVNKQQSNPNLIHNPSKGRMQSSTHNNSATQHPRQQPHHQQSSQQQPQYQDRVVDDIVNGFVPESVLAESFSTMNLDNRNQEWR